MYKKNRKTAGMAEPSRLPDVLITGGSSGIGLALAKKFAGEGYRVVIVGQHEERLKKAEEAIGGEVRGICLDLSETDSAEKLYSEVSSLRFSDGRAPEIGILVNNAGFGTIGPAEEIRIEKEEAQLNVNILTLTKLCKLYLRDFYQKGSGKILNVASTGAFQPGPYTGSYYASKAYVLSYTQALREEAKKHGVEVCALCPGTTKTSFFEKAGQKTPLWAMPPEKVAEIAYSGLMSNKGVIVPGLMNQALRLIPAPVKTFFVAAMKK